MIYFSLLMKMALLVREFFIQVRSLRQPVHINEGKHSCSMKQREILVGSDSRLTDSDADA